MLHSSINLLVNIRLDYGNERVVSPENDTQRGRRSIERCTRHRGYHWCCQTGYCCML